MFGRPRASENCWKRIRIRLSKKMMRLADVTYDFLDAYLVDVETMFEGLN